MMQEITDVLTSMICLRQLAVLAYVRGKEVRRERDRARARAREREREERLFGTNPERGLQSVARTQALHHLLITYAYLPMHSSLFWSH